MESLPVLDVKAPKPNALKQAVDIFNDLKAKPLRPINELDQDPVRRELDERFAVEVLGLSPAIATGPLALLCEKLAHEPSVAGSKIMDDPGEDDEEDNEEA